MNHLSESLVRVKGLIKQTTYLTKEYRADIECDINNSIKSISLWKANILMTINQGKRKQNILEELEHETAFAVINFAMKVFARKYRESMTDWFGKAEIGKHISCIALRKPSNDNGGRDGECQSFNKRTYITLIGKANQDAVAVMAIYQSVLEPVGFSIDAFHY